MIETSESITKVAGALVKAQKDLTNPAMTGTNPHFKSAYATLPAILDHIRPVLAKHGLAAMQSAGGEDLGTARIVTRILHESGEFVESEPLILQGQKSDAQGTGSAITYGRRYSLLSMLGIAGDDDDDGNAAARSGNGGKPAATPQPKLTKQSLYDELVKRCKEKDIPKDAVGPAVLDACSKTDKRTLTLKDFEMCLARFDEWFVGHARNFVVDNDGMLD